MAKLAEIGVHLDAWGMPHDTLPATTFDPQAPGRPSMPQRQRPWWQMLDEHRAAMKGHPEVDRERVTQCAGEEGGAWLMATVAEVGTSLSDPEFKTGLRLRLGLAVCPAGAPCQHTSRQNTASRPCGAGLDAAGTHAQDCKVGGEVNVLHDAGCKILLHATRAAGFAALAEQVGPELRSPQRKEPRLDLEAWGQPSLPRLLVDFTVRDLAATRYVAVRGEPAGTAAQGEQEKAVEYPSTGGVRVTGACMERLGRHGPGLAQLLQTLTDLARQRDSQRGQSSRRWLRMWRVQLACAAVRSSHRAITTAVTNCCGRQTLRHTDEASPP